jgi:hypothetical protein
MSLDELQSLAYAAGYGAVFDEDIDLARSEPAPHAPKTTVRHHADWRSPDAPAPRSALAASRSLTVVEPLWLAARPVAAPSSPWARHLQSASRSVTGLFAGRGVPA